MFFFLLIIFCWFRGETSLGLVVKSNDERIHQNSATVIFWIDRCNTQIGLSKTCWKFANSLKI